MATVLNTLRVTGTSYASTSFLATILVGCCLLLVGCSKWNLEPKEVDPTSSNLPAVSVPTTDVFTISGRGSVISFTFTVTPAPRTTITELGVCYSLTNKTPSLADPSGTSSVVKASGTTSPSSVGVNGAAKGTYYFRAYAQLQDGRVSYSQVGTVTL